MNVEKCMYNPDRDLQDVDQFGYIDLNRAYVEGVVLGDTKSDARQYNNIEDPRSIIGRPDDTFDALMMAQRYGEAVYGESSKNATAQGSETT